MSGLVFEETWGTQLSYMDPKCNRQIHNMLIKKLAMKEKTQSANDKKHWKPRERWQSTGDELHDCNGKNHKSTRSGACTDWNMQNYLTLKESHSWLVIGCFQARFSCQFPGSDPTDSDRCRKQKRERAGKEKVKTRHWIHPKPRMMTKSSLASTVSMKLTDTKTSNQSIIIMSEALKCEENT